MEEYDENDGTSADGYEVGFGKPPKEHQFKPGASGNPNGRPKRPTEPVQIVNHVMGEMVTVNIANERKRMTRFEVATRRLISRAMDGDIKAYKELLAVRNRHGANVIDLRAETLAEQERREKAGEELRKLGEQLDAKVEREQAKQHAKQQALLDELANAKETVAKQQEILSAMGVPARREWDPDR